MPCRRNVARGFAALCALAAGCAAPPAPSPPAHPESRFDVRAFGARGDGAADDTAAFADALASAGRAGGGTVHVPAGRYRINGNLDVPPNVTLSGVWEAPPRLIDAGSVLLAVAGAGDENGKPFITLRRCATLKGIAVFYPDQVVRNPPIPYPWCIRGHGDNCAILDVLLVNPYQAVDFGTLGASRHLIRGLYAQALRRGLYIDHCLDVGRVEDVHFWPFWMVEGGAPLKEFMQTQGEAFIIGQTDWQYMQGCFTIWYSVGFHFIGDDQHHPGNVVLVNCGADIGPTAVRVDKVQGHAGVSFVNGQFMAGVEVMPTNFGPVKFTSCGFWGVPDGSEKFMRGHARHATVAGEGSVMFTACHFFRWDTRNEGEPAIYVDGGHVLVNGCDFLDAKTQVVVGEKGGTAIITASRLRGGAKVENRGKGRVEMSANVER